MTVSGISRLNKFDPKSPIDLRSMAEELYLRLHVSGLQVKQKIMVITQLISMVSDAIEDKKSTR